MNDADVIVIGSGSGGLTAAVALAQAGQKVIVLEQHEVPGGWCHTFTRGGYHFSPGVHYVGQLEAGQATAQIYEGLGVADDLLFFELDSEAFEQCTVAGEKFNYCRGVDDLKNRFQERFPKDKDGIEDYFFYLQEIYNQIPLTTHVRSWRDMITIPYRTRYLGKYGLFSLKWMLEKRIKNPLARAFLSIQGGDHGLPPSLAPFAVHCGVAGHYFNGGYYPMGGGMAIPLALRKSLKKHGGEIRLNSKVEKIIIESNGSQQIAKAVKLSDGTTLTAHKILSNADPHQTFYKMVGRENISHKLQKKLDKTKYSLPAISLFFAVDIDVRKLGMSSGNIWYMRDTDFDKTYQGALDPNLYNQDQFDGLFVTALSLKDPTQFNGRHHTLEAVTFVGYEVFKAFEGSNPENRSGEYVKLKDKIHQMMLTTLEKAVPGITQSIVFSELGTPTTSAHFLNATEGSCYGTQKSRFQMGPFSYKNKSEIENLYLCGASTSAHGVSGAANSGISAASVMLGCYPEDILKNKNQKMRTYRAEDSSTWPTAIKEKILRHQSR